MSMVLTEQSILNKKWVLEDYKESLATKLKTQFNLPELVARIISQRCPDIESSVAYLNPKLRSSLPNPFDLKDMEKAARRFVEAIEKKERVAVFGDYDVDGITSSAIMHLFFDEIGYTNCEFHIPEREEDGYGPSIPVFDKFIKNKADLIVTVDCGITANEPIAHAVEKGVDVVVLDHHEPQILLPKAHALVDPKRLDEDGENTYFAAVGIVFLFLVAVNKLLRESGWFTENNKKPVDLLQFLDLVALGTVCDMVPLIKANRAFVATGLKIMKQRENHGIKALADVGKAGVIKEYHLGFVLGPRINAGGRVGYSRIGLDLLTAKDTLTAEILAEKLDRFNTERKEIESAIFVQAQEHIDKEDEKHTPLILIAKENWHPGVMGIIAGRLKEHYGRPTLAGVIDENGIVNGSGRSITGIDFGQLIMKAKEKGLVLEGGGHIMAVGFTCRKEKLEELRVFLKEEIQKEIGEGPLTRTLGINAVIDAGGLSFEMANTLSHLEPFGVNNHEPIFMLKNAQLAKATLFGTGHLKCFFRASNGKSLVVLLFGGSSNPLGQTVLNHIGETFDLAGHLRVNAWQGQKTIQFHLLDAVKA
ncbi:MAG: single-stranded-DNA-specific exonuclease RecJ [Alphaproteobacteria bacterium]|nr:single-stranded-DNA-specific exonuclease RecJ [Alphaproteobacteria bacterium]MBN2779454.1 single-stranded-DNA-specific exonuclease RecJ [Alphaproteobacteria bacterium]